MTWARRFRRREAMRQSLWLVPLGGAVVGAILAWGAASVGDTLDMPAALTFTPSTASAVLSAIIGAMIGLVGFVVTVTVLLVQTSTGQFSARYMRLLYRDQLLKAVLAGLLDVRLLGGLCGAWGDQGARPGLIVVGGLVLLGVVLFLVFLSRILQRLRPVAVASTVASLGTRAFLALVQPLTGERPRCRRLRTGAPTRSSARGSGTIQAVHLEGLLAWAEHHSCTLVLRHGVGDFVHVGSPLFDVRGPSPQPGTEARSRAWLPGQGAHGRPGPRLRRARAGGSSQPGSLGRRQRPDHGDAGRTRRRPTGT